MSLGAALVEGSMTTILGMSIVFIVLIMLTACLEAMKVFASPAAAVKAAEQSQAEPVKVVDEVPLMKFEDEKQDDAALIAVIAAALAAFTGRRASDIHVSSIRRVSSVETGWAAQARRDLIDSRRVLGS